MAASPAPGSDRLAARRRLFLAKAGLVRTARHSVTQEPWWAALPSWPPEKPFAGVDGAATRIWGGGTQHSLISGCRIVDGLPASRLFSDERLGSDGTVAVDAAVNDARARSFSPPADATFGGRASPFSQPPPQRGRPATCEPCGDLRVVPTFSKKKRAPMPTAPAETAETRRTPAIRTPSRSPPRVEEVLPGPQHSKRQPVLLQLQASAAGAPETTTKASALDAAPLPIVPLAEARPSPVLKRPSCGPGGCGGAGAGARVGRRGGGGGGRYLVGAAAVVPLRPMAQLGRRAPETWRRRQQKRTDDGACIGSDDELASPGSVSSRGWFSGSICSVTKLSFQEERSSVGPGGSRSLAGHAGRRNSTAKASSSPQRHARAGDGERGRSISIERGDVDGPSVRKEAQRRSSSCASWTSSGSSGSSDLEFRLQKIETLPGDQPVPPRPVDCRSATPTAAAKRRPALITFGRRRTAPGRQQAAPCRRRLGRVRWFRAEEGVGYVAPNDGTADVLILRPKKPEVAGASLFSKFAKGTRVSYIVGAAEDGRPCAVDLEVEQDEHHANLFQVRPEAESSAMEMQEQLIGERFAMDMKQAIHEGVYALRCKRSDYYLAVVDQSQENMAGVHQRHSRHADPSTRWMVKPVRSINQRGPEGVYTLQNVHSGKFLCVGPDGRICQQARDSTTMSSRWRLENCKLREYRLANVDTGRYVCHVEASDLLGDYNAQVFQSDIAEDRGARWMFQTSKPMTQSVREERPDGTWLTKWSGEDSDSSDSPFSSSEEEVRGAIESFDRLMVCVNVQSMCSSTLNRHGRRVIGLVDHEEMDAGASTEKSKGRKQRKRKKGRICEKPKKANRSLQSRPRQEERRKKGERKPLHTRQSSLMGSEADIAEAGLAASDGEENSDSDSIAEDRDPCEDEDRGSSFAWEDHPAAGSDLWSIQQATGCQVALTPVEDLQRTPQIVACRTPPLPAASSADDARAQLAMIANEDSASRKDERRASSSASEDAPVADSGMRIMQRTGKCRASPPPAEDGRITPQILKRFTPSPPVAAADPRAQAATAGRHSEGMLGKGAASSSDAPSADVEELRHTPNGTLVQAVADGRPAKTPPDDHGELSEEDRNLRCLSRELVSAKWLERQSTMSPCGDSNSRPSSRMSASRRPTPQPDGPSRRFIEKTSTESWAFLKNGPDRKTRWYYLKP